MNKGSSRPPPRRVPSKMTSREKALPKMQATSEFHKSEGATGDEHGPQGKGDSMMRVLHANDKSFGPGDTSMAVTPSPGLSTTHADSNDKHLENAPRSHMLCKLGGTCHRHPPIDAGAPMSPLERDLMARAAASFAHRWLISRSTPHRLCMACLSQFPTHSIL